MLGSGFREGYQGFRLKEKPSVKVTWGHEKGPRKHTVLHKMVAFWGSM